MQAAHMHKLVATLAAAARFGCHCSSTLSVLYLLEPAILRLFCYDVHTPAYKGIQLVAAFGGWKQKLGLCVTAVFVVAAVFGGGWHQSGADLCAQPQGDVQDCQVPSGGGHEER